MRGGPRRGSGRKPVPAALRLIMGGKGTRNPSEPMPEPELPEPPPHLSAVAVAEWHRVAPQLYGLRVLTSLDRACLAGYCTQWATYVEAQEQLRKFGLVVKTPIKTITRRKRDGAELIERTGGYIQQSPFLSVSNRASDLMLKFAVELGMSPSSRRRVSVAPPDTPPDPSRKYLA